MTDDNVHVPDATDSVIKLDPKDIDKAKDWEEFVSLWMVSKEIDLKNQWYKGDIANKVAIVHGENSLTKFSMEVQESPRTMEHYRRVARAFPAKTRGWNLGWTHYLIASFADSFNKKNHQFDSNNRFKWIMKAHDNNWSTAKLQAEIKKRNAIADGLNYFQYYSLYLDKLDNVLLHCEKDKMSPQERDDLIKKLLDTYNRFQVYMREQ